MYKKVNHLIIYCVKKGFAIHPSYLLFFNKIIPFVHDVRVNICGDYNECIKYVSYNGFIHKEGHADPPPSEITPSKSDWKWCAMF